MLGRLQMDVDECIVKYQKISAAAFQAKRSPADVLGRGKDLWKGKGRYKGDRLVEEFKQAALEFEDNEDATLFSNDAKCKVQVDYLPA
ncbi:phospholipase- patatin family protein [Apiospora kogelbergensis]|uniref:phospholipase- patatin family protein n=1 Tax=Apiospora kogelbergensis TaxID=1337665 RepID=UPI00312F8BAC